MTEKKGTVRQTTNKKAGTKTNSKTVSQTVATPQPVAVINEENVGFRAGDVYQTLADARKALSIEVIAKEANIPLEEAYLGIGWLFREGKVKGENNLVALA